MEKYQMNRPGCCRPYNNTCGMSRPQTAMPYMENRNMPAHHEKMEKNGCCNCIMPGTSSNDTEMYSHLQHLTPAMAYVPCQVWGKTFELCRALPLGTIFPDLCKPFCGKRGGCR